MQYIYISIQVSLHLIIYYIYLYQQLRSLVFAYCCIRQYLPVESQYTYPEATDELHTSINVYLPHTSSPITAKSLLAPLNSIVRPPDIFLTPSSSCDHCIFFCNK